MKGLKRSLLYWGNIMEKYFFSIFFVILVMSAVMEILQRGEGLKMIPVYVPMVGIIAVMVQASGNISYNLPQAISFGATRKESLIGMEVFTHIIVVQVMIIMALCAKYIPNPTEIDNAELFPIYAVLFLFTCGASNAVCAATMRFGNKVGTCIYMIYLLLIVFLVIGIIVAGSSFGNIRFWLIEYSGWGAIAAVIFDVVMIGCCAKAIRKFEVRV